MRAGCVSLGRVGIARLGRRGMITEWEAKHMSRRWRIDRVPDWPLRGISGHVMDQLHEQKLVCERTLVSKQLAMSR